MKMVWGIVRWSKAREIENALRESGFYGMSWGQVFGTGEETVKHPMAETQKFVRFQIVASDSEADQVVKMLLAIAHTGVPGDGIVAVMPVEAAYKVGTGAPMKNHKE